MNTYRVIKIIVNVYNVNAANEEMAKLAIDGPDAIQPVDVSTDIRVTELKDRQPIPYTKE